ncbi:MAG: hypothetical protein HY096_10755 [Nitrospinae bacterium]|nr:hypothetical protein [Nitrospinota bacterium]
MKNKIYILMSLSLLLWGCASMWNDANKLYQNKDYEGALTIYQEAERKEPNGLQDSVNARQYKETRKEIANKYYREALNAAKDGKLNEAIPLLKKAGELDPKNMDVKDALQRLQSRKDEGMKKADLLFNQGSSYLKEKKLAWGGEVF